MKISGLSATKEFKHINPLQEPIMRSLPLKGRSSPDFNLMGRSLRLSSDFNLSHLPNSRKENKPVAECKRRAGLLFLRLKKRGSVIILRKVLQTNMQWTKAFNSTRERIAVRTKIGRSRIFKILWHLFVARLLLRFSILRSSLLMMK